MQAQRQSIFWSDPSRRSDWLTLTVPYVFLLFGLLYLAFEWNGRFAALSPLVRVLLLAFAVAYSLIPTLYWWNQSWQFEEWIADTDLDPVQKEFEKERFKTNREIARAFWAAIIAVFAAYLIGGK